MKEVPEVARFVKAADIDKICIDLNRSGINVKREEVESLYFLINDVTYHEVLGKPENIPLFLPTMIHHFCRQEKTNYGYDNVSRILIDELIDHPECAGRYRFSREILWQELLENPEDSEKYRLYEEEIWRKTLEDPLNNTGLVALAEAVANENAIRRSKGEAPLDLPERIKNTNLVEEAVA